VSSALLTAIAISLSRAHAAFTIDTDSIAYDNKDYWMDFLPETLHFGWTTAASLVNCNGGALGLAVSGRPFIVFATAGGVSIMLYRGAPVFGLVIAWALSACASGIKQRLEPETTHNSNYFSIHHMNDTEKAAGVYGSRVQRVLCSVGEQCVR
jgi:hypothetical protein